MSNIWSMHWGESEDKVIEAMKIIKDYCEHTDICNACPMFLTCTQIGCKKTWEIEDMRGKKMDCRACQWGWLSEEGDKYNDSGYLICDNGESPNCGRVVGTASESWGIDCEDFEEPL